MKWNAPSSASHQSSIPTCRARPSQLASDSETEKVWQETPDVLPGRCECGLPSPVESHTNTMPTHCSIIGDGFILSNLYSEIFPDAGENYCTWITIVFSSPSQMMQHQLEYTITRKYNQHFINLAQSYETALSCIYTAWHINKK